MGTPPKEIGLYDVKKVVIAHAGVILAVIVVSAGIVSAWAVEHHQTSVNTKKISEIDGAMRADRDILIGIKKDVEWIKETLTTRTDG